MHNNNNNNNNNKKAGKKKIQTLKVSQMNGKLHSVSSVLAPSEMHSSILS